VNDPFVGKLYHLGHHVTGLRLSKKANYLANQVKISSERDTDADARKKQLLGMGWNSSVDS
jgi:hypothetical protein